MSMSTKILPDRLQHSPRLECLLWQWAPDESTRQDHLRRLFQAFSSVILSVKKWWRNLLHL